MFDKNNTSNTKLLKEVNPVFTTAQACLLVMAEAGDEYAQKLVHEFGFDHGGWSLRIAANHTWDWIFLL